MLARLTGASSSPSKRLVLELELEGAVQREYGRKRERHPQDAGREIHRRHCRRVAAEIEHSRTSTVNTTADRIAVRDRNSTSRSLRASSHPWRRISTTGHRRR